MAEVLPPDDRWVRSMLFVEQLPRCDLQPGLAARVPVDIAPDQEGMVRPAPEDREKGDGLSVARHYRFLPPNLVPTRLGGKARLPVEVFQLQPSDVNEPLSFRPDKRNNPRHAVIEPSALMLLAAFQDAICATALHWERLP